MLRRSLLLLASLSIVSSVGAQVAPAPAPAGPVTPPVINEVIVSVKEQKLMLLQNGAKVTTYPVSTSKFGLGDGFGRMTTPVGAMAVAQKIGDHAPLGAVFKTRRFTGEILKPNAPGRDPIVTRILWLKGLEGQNRNAYGRTIYIHGTPEEHKIGTPASFGCVRMRSYDVVRLFDTLGVGARVDITTAPLPPPPNAGPVEGERLAATRPAGD